MRNLLIVLVAAWVVVSAPAGAQTVSCISTRSDTAGGTSTISGANSCGVDMQVNICALLEGQAQQNQFSRLLKNGQSYSFSLPNAQGSRLQSSMNYCRPGSPAAACAAKCPAPVLAQANGAILPTLRGCAEFAYPAAALRQDASGSVTLQVTVGADGRARNVKVVKSSGYDSLDEAAAINVTRTCRFNPGRPPAGADSQTFVMKPITYAVPE